MREFMTRLKDRLSEKWNDPEHREDRLAVVIVGTAAAVVIIALLLVLWGYLAGGRGGAGEEASGDALQIATYEEKMKEYMAQNKGQADLWQEYAARVDLMNGEVEELLAAMTQTRQSLTETIEQYQEGDILVQKELTTVRTQVDSVVQSLKETQTQLYDLTDIVQVMSEETIPLIREQLKQLEGDMEQTQADIAEMRAGIDALEQTDAELWESIADVRNMLGNVESIIENMSGQVLRYRYDEENRTLYLDPYRS